MGFGRAFEAEGGPKINPKPGLFANHSKVSTIASSESLLKTQLLIRCIQLIG